MLAKRGRSVKIELVTHSNGELAESDFEAFTKQCGKFTNPLLQCRQRRQGPLKHMRQFYLAFPIGHTLCDELNWSTKTWGQSPSERAITCNN